jgi:hypothetical protein
MGGAGIGAKHQRALRALGCARFSSFRSLLFEVRKASDN